MGHKDGDAALLPVVSLPPTLERNWQTGRGIVRYFVPLRALPQ